MDITRLLIGGTIANTQYSGSPPPAVIYKLGAHSPHFSGRKLKPFPPVKPPCIFLKPCVCSNTTKSVGYCIINSPRPLYSPLYSGIPDAPLDVQVEAGPQKGSVLITWLPVTITTAGTSNGAKVLGYAVFADGACIDELMSPTGG